MSKYSVNTSEGILEYQQSVYDLLRRIFLWEFPLAIFDLLVTTSKTAEGEQSFSPAEQPLFNYLKSISNGDIPTVYKEIQIEYARLFVGPYHLPTPPFESVYRTPAHLMMQEITIDVRTAYSKNGFQVVKMNQEPDDHIGLEFEFVYAMSGKALEAFQKMNLEKLAEFVSEQDEFCQDHLFKWVPEFCHDLKNSTKLEFWRAVAEFTESFLKEQMQNKTACNTTF